MTLHLHYQQERNKKTTPPVLSHLYKPSSEPPSWTLKTPRGHTHLPVTAGVSRPAPTPLHRAPCCRRLWQGPGRSVPWSGGHSGHTTTADAAAVWCWCPLQVLPSQPEIWRRRLKKCTSITCWWGLGISVGVPKGDPTVPSWRNRRQGIAAVPAWGSGRCQTGWLMQQTCRPVSAPGTKGMTACLTLDGWQHQQVMLVCHFFL